MKLTYIICLIFLIAIAICGGVYAFWGFNALLFLCFNNVTVMRVLLALGFVSALFTIYAIIALKKY